MSSILPPAPDSNPLTPPVRHLEPSWFDVVDLMDYYARRNRDELLYLMAHQVGDLVDDHYNGDQGCSDCNYGRDDVEYCQRWTEAQHHMLAWLLDRAAP